MTTTSDRPVRPHPGDPEPAATLARDLDDLRRVLADQPFPTHQDDLIALVVARREPARLACRLSSLSRTRTYASVDEVCDAVRHAASTS